MQQRDWVWVLGTSGTESGAERFAGRPGRAIATLVSAVLLACTLALGVSGSAWASGVLKRTPGTEKDAFIAQAEVIFIGPADYWDSTYDPETDAPYSGLVAGAPATDPAREYLDNVDIDLGSLAVLRVEISSASASGGTATHTVSSVQVKMGELVFSDFSSTILQSATGDTGPYAYSALNSACSDYTLAGCDWVWGQGLYPSTVSPSGTGLQFDNSFPAGTSQHGLLYYYGGDVETLPENSGPVETTSVTSPSYVMIDLVVPALPPSWMALYGSNVRVAAQVSGGIYYYAVYVPAMGFSGGALLVVLVLAAGLGVLCYPLRRGV